jgi:hypothetical protein
MFFEFFVKASFQNLGVYVNSLFHLYSCLITLKNTIFNCSVSQFVARTLSFSLVHNGYMYETLGIAGFVPVCRCKSRCVAECLN